MTQDIHSTQARPEPHIDWPDQGQDLPDQGGGGRRSTLAPGIYTFRLPDVLAPLWHDIEAEDRRKFLGNGQPNPMFGQRLKRRQLKFDRNSPLVVETGPHAGEPMTATFSTVPRPRSFKKNASEDPQTPWISDVAYLLDTSLNDKTRPSDVRVLEATVNKYAGKTIRLEIGRSAQCRPDKVRYIRVQTQVNGSVKEETIQDPSGKKGCGTRYYTGDFKNPQGGVIDPATGQPIPAWDDELSCGCGVPSDAEKMAGAVEQDVVLRGFEQVERFLPPQG